MDKIFFLMQRMDDELLKSQTLLHDKELFGPLRCVVVARFDDELAKVFGESSTERTNEFLKYALCLTFFGFVISVLTCIFLVMMKDEDDDNTTLLDKVCFASFKRKDPLEHAYTITAWTLSLHPEICADCADQMSTDNSDLRKLIDEVVPACTQLLVQTKKLQQKVLMTTLTFSGKILKDFTNCTGPYS